jgi:GAF domain-containing protein
MSVPMLTTDRTLGTLNFGSQALNAFDNRQRDLAIQAASLISGIIENQELYEQTQRRAQREQALRQITAAVRGSTDPATIMRTAVRELGTALGRRTQIRFEQFDGSVEEDNGNS